MNRNKIVMRIFTCVGLLGMLFLLPGRLTAQMRVASWNVTNYSSAPLNSDSRNSAFQTCIYGVFEGRSMSPDVMLGQEFTSATAVTSFVNLLNSAPGSPGDWAAAPFVDGPDTDSTFFYRTSRFNFLEYVVVFAATGSTSQPPRNVMRYDVSPKGYSSGCAPVMAMYSTHMKSSTGSADKSRRLQEATYIRNDAQTLPAGWNFLMGGDTNIQSSSESAYQELVGPQLNDSGRFYDPIDSPGTWYSNSTYRFIHTQDPIGSGGMDDRHDQLLLCHSLIDGIGFDYIGNPSMPYSTSTWNDPNHSYRAWGNDGSSFNLSLTTTGNTMVGPAIAQALRTSAAGGGHLPVFLDLRLSAELDAAPESVNFGNVVLGSNSEQSVSVWNGVDSSIWGTAGIAPLGYGISVSPGFDTPAGPFSDYAGSAASEHFVAPDTSSYGLKTGTLVITPTDPNIPAKTIALSANVVAEPVTRISKSSDGTYVNIVDGVLTAAFTDSFYIENADRSVGIRVQKTAHGLTSGKVTVTGVLRTNGDGERYIDAITADSSGAGSVPPVGMSNTALGGSDTAGYVAGGAGQAGVSGGVGVNNIGLLVRVWGKVVEVEDKTPPALPTWFKIDDGSGGIVKCVAESGAAVSVGAYVTLSGVSSCENADGQSMRVVRVASPPSIVTY